MRLTARLLRAWILLAVIFCSYMLQFALVRLFGRVQQGKDGVRELGRPQWLTERRKRTDERNAVRLLGGILRLRGVYIKLGQVLSILGGFMPAAYLRRLETLQDKVPARPFSEVRTVLVRSLRRPPEECFASIEAEPIAAASLGQVHAARLPDGTHVAVKILYPRIRETIRLDMKVVKLALAIYKRFMPVGNIEVVHRSLVDLLRRETDYLHEAECMRRIRDNFVAVPDVFTPEVIDALTSREVLTMTFMRGIKITHIDEMRAAGIDPDAVATRLVQSFYKQLFVDRYFHADPHPGNFLVRAGPSPSRPELVLLDFGTVTIARDNLIDGMLEQLQGFFAQDGARVLHGFERMGFVAAEGNRELLEETVMLYFRRLLQVKHRTPGAVMRADQERLRNLANPRLEFEQLRELARAFVYPEGWFYIERSLVMLFWLVGQIAPDVDMLQVGFPYVVELLSKQARVGQHSAG